MNIIDWAFVALYFSLLIVIGVQSVRRISGSDDFAVAGGRIIWPVIFATLAASFLGGGSSMGNAGNVFRDGYVFLFAFFAFSIQTVLVGLFVAHKLRRYEGAHTVGDVMEAHYGCGARVLTGVLSIAVCAGSSAPCHSARPRRCTAPAETASMSSRVWSRSASRAAASRCSTVFVDPPIATSSAMAL